MTERRDVPTERPSAEVMEFARWLVEAMVYPYDLQTSVVPPPIVQDAVFFAWMDRYTDVYGTPEEEWASLCDEGMWTT